MIFTCKRGHSKEPYIDKNGYSNCRVCRCMGVIRYTKNNLDKIVNQREFGGNRYKCLERDNYTCVNCGMDNKEHLERWGRTITVDHIDGNGRYKKAYEKNHDLSNLQTLCLSCHGKKDVARRKKYSNYYIKQKEMVGI